MPGARDRLPFVLAQKAKGKLYLYCQRDGRRVPLPGPEGSAASRRECDNVHAAFEAPVGSTTYGRHTVGAAIGLYLNSADFKTLSEVEQA